MKIKKIDLENMAPNKITEIIKFPYYKYTVSKKKILKIFEELKNTKIITHNTKYVYESLTINKTYNNEDLVIIAQSNKNDDVEKLSDYFNEKCRLKCKLNGKKTVKTFYKKYIGNIIDDMIKWNNKMNIINLRIATRSLALKNKYSLCSYFNPRIIKYFIEYFNAKKILDMSSGWGDRLIGAMACDIDLYHGFDPNHCLHKGYNKIINFFTPINKNAEYIIKEQAFEQSILQDNFYDLMMSSPPYYAIEMYDKKSNKQSVNGHISERDWYEKYLKVWMIKIKNAVKVGGIIAMNIWQKKNQHFVTWLIDDFNKDDGLIYLGTIGWTMNSDIFVNPVFIWKKCDETIVGCNETCAFYRSIKKILTQKKEVTKSELEKINACNCGFFNNKKYHYSVEKNLINNFELKKIKTDNDIDDYIKFNFFDHNKVNYVVSKIVGKSKFVNQIPKRDTNINLSPESQIEQYTYNNKKFNIIREDLLYCGTKQRAAYDFITDNMTYLEKKYNIKYNEILYQGSFNGYGQITVSLCAFILNIKSSIYLTNTAFGDENAIKYNDDILENTVQIKKLRQLNANITFCDKWTECYNLIDQKINKNNKIFMVPKGLYTKDFRYGNFLIEKIKISTAHIINPKRIWVICGVGLLAICLSQIFPNTEIMAVLTSNHSMTAQNNIDKYPNKNITIIQKSSNNYFVPYPSVFNYDTNSWNTAIEHGSDGDYIWNTAGDVELEQ